MQRIISGMALVPGHTCGMALISLPRSLFITETVLYFVFVSDFNFLMLLAFGRGISCLELPSIQLNSQQICDFLSDGCAAGSVLLS
jgi:hypothetical protein